VTRARWPIPRTRVTRPRVKAPMPRTLRWRLLEPYGECQQPGRGQLESHRGAQRRQRVFTHLPSCQIGRDPHDGSGRHRRRGIGGWQRPRVHLRQSRNLSLRIREHGARCRSVSSLVALFRWVILGSEPKTSSAVAHGPSTHSMPPATCWMKSASA